MTCPNCHRERCPTLRVTTIDDQGWSDADCLRAQLAAARATNRDLNRRVQAAEGDFSTFRWVLSEHPYIATLDGKDSQQIRAASELKAMADAALARAAKLATVARGLGEALICTRRYVTAASPAALRSEVDAIDAALAALRELEGA